MKLGEVVKYVVKIDFGVGAKPCVAMNLDVYNSLPPDIQKIFDDNMLWWGEKVDEVTAEAAKESVQWGKDNGVTFLELSQEEIQKMYDIIDATLIEEVDKLNLEAKGLPAVDIIKEAFRLSD
jgi:TRAP-type C4-dicarboxylate transport system substrate-binding protein